MILRRIPDYLEDCPQGWRNFIEDIRLRIEPNEDGGFNEATIQTELHKFRAKYADQSPWLVFNDDRMYNVFVLKYGDI